MYTMSYNVHSDNDITKVLSISKPGLLNETTNALIVDESSSFSDGTCVYLSTCYKLIYKFINLL